MGNTPEQSKIAYSGIEGSFAQIAVSGIFPDAAPVPYRNFHEAYDAVLQSVCDAAVLPIENSYAGEVGQVTELMFHGALAVTGVYELPIRHCLLGIPGAGMDTVKTVVSHPQALEQCSDFVALHGFEILSYENTARAAWYVANEGDPTKAAIASSVTAKLYGLHVIEDNISDSPDNTTRFAVFKKPDTGYNETGQEGGKVNSILLFTVRHESGTLARALSVLSDFGYNMRMIRSRPLKNRNWEYYFYTEVEGDLFSEKGKQMLSGLKYECGELKVVGTYEPGLTLEA